jgi:hypothetical protein
MVKLSVVSVISVVKKIKKISASPRLCASALKFFIPSKGAFL